MVRYFLAGFLVLLLSVPQASRAGGFPVFDGVNLGQSITGYIQNLMDYAEQLSQLSMLDSQYLTQLQQYQRELEEYQHYLRQVEQLGSVVSAADWQKILEQTITYYGNSPWASIPNVNVMTSKGAESVKTIVETAYDLPENVADTVTEWKGRIPGYQMTSREQAAHAKDYAHMQRLVDRQMAVAKNQDDMNTRSPMIADFKDKANNLGEDSHLQTQQLIAQQMAFLLQQQEIQSSQLNQLIGSQETMSEFAAAKSAEAREATRSQQEKHKNNYMPSALGSDLWKNL